MMKFGSFLYFVMLTLQNVHWKPMKIGIFTQYLLIRLLMLELSLKDSNLENRNIFVKTYEQECFYDLYPTANPTDPNISVSSFMLRIIVYSLVPLT